MKVEIVKFDYFGRGIGKINDKIVFVNRALPKEIVNVSLIKEKKHFSEGIINNLVKKSDDRIEAICPFYHQCGGCDFLHTTYNVEKKFKIAKAKELLGRCDNFYETKEMNYRNKVTLHVKNGKIGYYKEKTNDLVKINYCYLLDNNINKVINDLNKINLQDYDIKTIVIKANQGKILVNIDGAVDEKFVNCIYYVDTIISKNKIIKGNGYLEETIKNKRFKITSEAFFQVNKEGLENIYQVISKNIQDKKINNALDLYSGTGLWGILISEYVKSVTCIEINTEACLNAKDNLLNNNIKNVKIINGDVSKYIDSFCNIDLVITDPPRSGLNIKTVNYLKKFKAKYFIYISCDMQTLKRDLDLLKDVYEIQTIELVDMFKRTYHCETVVILERKAR